MAIIASPKANAAFERKQVVRLPKKGIYGAMLAAYSMPKQYNTTYGPKEQIVFRFVITHDQANKQLQRFSGAFSKVTNIINEKSNLVGILYALKGGKMTKDEIIAGEGVYDYDDFISKPVSLFIDPDQNPDKDGFFGNYIKAIDPADKDLQKAILSLWKNAIIKTNEKTGLNYLESPTEQYEEPGADPGPTEAPDDDELPF